LLEANLRLGFKASQPTNWNRGGDNDKQEIQLDLLGVCQEGLSPRG